MATFQRLRRTARPRPCCILASPSAPSARHCLDNDLTDQDMSTESNLMQADIQIRWATPDDSQAIAETQISAWRVAYSGIIPADVLEGLSVKQRADGFRDGITKIQGNTAVAEIRGNIVGSSSFGDCRDADKTESTGEVCAIYLDPSYWRKGIGRKLLNWSEYQLSLRGKHEIVLWVLKKNTSSRHFYESCGYREDGATKTVTIGTDLTAVRYARLQQAE